MTSSVLKLPVEPPGKGIYRPVVGIVAGVSDELIVEGEVCRGGDSVAVIHLDDLLESGTRQLSVADEDAQASGVEKRLVDTSYVVDDAGDPDRVVGPAPLLAGDRDARF